MEGNRLGLCVLHWINIDRFWSFTDVALLLVVNLANKLGFANEKKNRIGGKIILYS